MKSIQMVLVAFFLALGTNNAVAGGGHYHGPVSELQAGSVAQNVVNNMARQGNLAPTWATVQPSSLDKTTLDGNMVWRAAFANDQETDPSKRNLHAYLTLTGGFIKADYAAK